MLTLHRILCGGLQPDITILMDSDVAASVERARRRNRSRSVSNPDESNENRFEQESRAFFGRVHKAYLEIASTRKEARLLVDARGTPKQTHAKIVEIARRKLKLGSK